MQSPRRRAGEMVGRDDQQNEAVVVPLSDLEAVRWNRRAVKVLIRSGLRTRDRVAAIFLAACRRGAVPGV